MPTILSELRRRRLFRVVALYVVGAWVALQVADLAFPGLGVADESIRYVWLAALLCFPIAVIVGWRYDLSGGRLVRTAVTAGGTPESPGKRDVALLGALSLAAVAICTAMLWRIADTRSPAGVVPVAAAADPRSIAVLPFENLSGDDANQSFTSGIHDDVLTHVARIGGIRVISRNSVERLDPGMSIREMAALLSVATVLEGGVQRVGDQIRINVQLIDAQTDAHLWADTFDHALTPQSVFAVQTRIARAIADALHVTLSLRESETLDRNPTTSLEAYQAYLQGKRHMSLRTEAGLLEAERYFRLALEHDPGFALAHVGLADTNTILASYGIRPQDEATPTVRAAIDAALRLDAQLGAAHAAQALHFSGTGRFADAEQAFQRAISLDPNYAPAFHWYGNILVAGLFDPARAVPLLEKARLLDPLSPVIVLTLGEAYDALGRFEEAMAMFRKSIEIEPGFASGYARIAMLYRTVYGRTAESVRWYREELHRDATRDSSFLAFTYLEMGDDERAEFWFRHALDYRPDGVLPQVGMLSLALYRDDNELALARAREFADRFPNVNFGIFALLMLGQHEEVLERYVGQFPLLSCDREVPSVSRANLFQAINLSLALV